MARMQSEEEMAVALLHDVIEDSEYTADDRLEAEIPQTLVDAVQLLSKTDNESYEEFIDKVLTNDIATKVKIADIEDNINVLRLDSLSERDLQSVAKYHKAWQKLQFKR